MVATRAALLIEIERRRQKWMRINTERRAGPPEGARGCSDGSWAKMSTAKKKMRKKEEDMKEQTAERRGGETGPRPGPVA